MVRWMFVMTAAPVLLACSSPEEMVEGLSVGETAAQQLDRRTGSGAAPAEFNDNESNGDAAREFAYAWPAQVSAIPPLAAMLSTARDEALAAQKAEWQQSVEEFGDADGGYQCFSCVNRLYSKGWEVVADTPRFLILVGETYTYTGGAHGNSRFDALLWDREAEDGEGGAMRPVDLFVHEGALENTAYGDYCQALLEAKRDKLDIDITEMNPFDGCPSVSELVVVPISSDGESFDRIRFLAAPYVAGSFAEGPYTFEIAMTEPVLDVVKPEYRAVFALTQ